jgi:hydrogenase/urease accessory protein HupE
MNAAARLAFVLALLLAPDAARAHPAFAGVDGFTGGLLHPFFVLGHALAIIATGLLIAQQAQRWLLRTAFVFGFAVGSVAIATAYVPTLADVMLLVLALVAGALVALGKPLPPLLSGLLAVAVGGAIALDSPPDAITVREAIETQLGTFCSATVFLYAMSEAASRLKQHWQHIGVRIVGSWIAASAVLALTLQFAK